MLRAGAGIFSQRVGRFGCFSMGLEGMSVRTTAIGLIARPGDDSLRSYRPRCYRQTNPVLQQLRMRVPHSGTVVRGAESYPHFGQSPRGRRSTARP